jgi:TolB-like protein
MPFPFSKLYVFMVSLVAVGSLMGSLATRADEDSDSLDSKLNSGITVVAKGLDGKMGKIAIMDFPSTEGGINGLSSYISNTATNQLINQSREVVDRVTFEKALKEQKLQQSSLIDSKTAARVGKLAGAKFLMLGNYNRLPRSLKITIRLLSVETAQFISAQEVSVPMNGDNTELVNSLIKQRGTEVGNVSLEAPPSDSPAATPTKPVETGKTKSKKSQDDDATAEAP